MQFALCQLAWFTITVSIGQLSVHVCALLSRSVVNVKWSCWCVIWTNKWWWWWRLLLKLTCSTVWVALASNWPGLGIKDCVLKHLPGYVHVCTYPCYTSLQLTLPVCVCLSVRVSVSVCVCVHSRVSPRPVAVHWEPPLQTLVRCRRRCSTAEVVVRRRSVTSEQLPQPCRYHHYRSVVDSCSCPGLYFCLCQTKFQRCRNISSVSLPRNGNATS